VEYFAIITFISGIILLIIGIVLPDKTKRRFEGFVKNEIGTETRVSPSMKQKSTPDVSIAPPPSNPFPFVEIREPSQAPVNPHGQGEPTVQDSSVKVHIAQTNPALWEKTCYLYLDPSSRNTYTGNETSFDLHLAKDIHRVGKGNFTYMGNSFDFHFRNEKKAYPINQIDHLAFYPNCLVIVPKNGLPSAMLFMDETDSLRKILETFRIDDGNDIRH